MSGAAHRPARISGQVVAAFGRNFLVQSDDGRFLHCLPRGKGAALACGDRVLVDPTGRDCFVIEAVDPRANVLLRASPSRTKLIAANATQAAVVVAAEPSFSDELVMRALIAGANTRMKVFILLNKVDLAAGAQAARLRLQPFASAGYRIVEIAATGDASPLLPLLNDETTVLVGQSGMGKSTLVNALVPEADAATNEISRFLESGRHTTTAARLYRLDGRTALIDTPGMKEFGLAHLEAAEIEASVPEFQPFLGRCRFPDCRHRSEPGCALRHALDQGKIHPRRFELFHRIMRDEAHGA